MRKRSLVQDLWSSEQLERQPPVAGATEPTAERAPDDTGPAPVEGPVALLAFHGMGQQVRFGTIEETVGVLEAAAKRRGWRVALKDRKQLPAGERFIPCAELVVETDARRVEVHVFETYWAPLTEGRISAWETFSFLVRSAKEAALNGRRFTRYLFSTENPPKGEVKTVPRGTLLGLGLTALTMGALWVLDAVVVAIVLSSLMVASEPRWLPQIRAALITDYAGAIALVAGIGLVFLGLPALLKSLRSKQAPPPALYAFSVVGNLALKATPIMLCLIALDIALVCVAAAAPELRGRMQAWFGPLTSSWILSPFLAWDGLLGSFHGSRVFLLGLGATFFAGSSRVRSFVREYVGDVAIYVSSHKVNRFFETRAAIQKTAFEMARFLYDRRVGKEGSSLYAKVVFLGHSLGSVIAYDTLNRMLLEDSAAEGGRRVRERTKALVTYGSPLDKIAFVFRTQRRKDGSLREAMVGSLQPLIQDLSARTYPWVNVFSRFDWIGGSLDFYDPKPGGPGPYPAFPVANVPDGFALTPVAAHGEHGEGPILQGVVLDAVLETLEDNASFREALAAARAS